MPVEVRGTPQIIPQSVRWRFEIFPQTVRQTPRDVHQEGVDKLACKTCAENMEISVSIFPVTNTQRYNDAA